MKEYYYKYVLKFFLIFIPLSFSRDIFEVFRAAGRPENPEVPVLFGGHNLPPLVEIGLTDLPKSGGAMAPLAPPGTTGLCSYVCMFNRKGGKNVWFLNPSRSEKMLRLMLQSSRLYYKKPF